MPFGGMPPGGMPPYPGFGMPPVPYYSDRDRDRDRDRTRDRDRPKVRNLRHYSRRIRLRAFDALTAEGEMGRPDNLTNQENRNFKMLRCKP